MNKYTYRPMENITGFEVAGIQATDPADYDKMPDQLKRHFVITVIPDPIVKVKPAPVVAPAAPKKASKPRRRKS
jgi:hypothetical protein